MTIGAIAGSEHTNQGEAPSAFRQVEIVRRFYEAFAEGAVSELFFLTREDVDLGAPMAFGLPMGGRCRGRSQLAAFFELLRGAVAVTHFEVRDVVERGDVVLVSGAASGFAPRTGRAFETGWTHVFTMRGGRIARLRAFFDRNAVAGAFSRASTHKPTQRAA